MSCENKLTNLVFKNKENSARIQCTSFFLRFFPPPPFFYCFLFFLLFFVFLENKKMPRMKCNATPRDKRKKTQKPKNKEQ